MHKHLHNIMLSVILVKQEITKKSLLSLFNKIEKSILSFIYIG